MGDFLDGATFSTPGGYPSSGSESGLGKQLMQVARIISTRVDRKAERDLFFVERGGWDFHANVNDNLREYFVEVNAALQPFVEELEHQGTWNRTVIATTSEFGRSLTSNA